MVLENEYDDFGDDETISATLQIKASDVDFGSPPSALTEQGLQPTHSLNQGNDVDMQTHKPIIVRFPSDNGLDNEQNVVSNDRLPKVGKGKSDIKRTSPMFLDSFQNRNARRGIFPENENSDGTLQSLIFRPFDLIRNSNNNVKENLNDDSNNIAEIVVVRKPMNGPIPQENGQVKETTASDDQHITQGLEFLGNTEQTQEQGNTVFVAKGAAVRRKLMII